MSKDDDGYQCTDCGETVAANAKVCPHCAAVFAIEYYSLSTGKLIFLSIISFGFFDLYWFYKNWALIKEYEESDVVPALRCVFSVFFNTELFSRVLVSARGWGYEDSYKPWFLTGSYFVISCLGLFHGPLRLAGMFAFIPLIPIQHAINFNNSNIQKGFDLQRKFSADEFAVVIVAWVFILVCIILGALL